MDARLCAIALFGVLLASKMPAEAESLETEEPEAVASTEWTYSLLREGGFINEAPASTGEQWWGLFETTNGMELLPTTLTVTPFKSACGMLPAKEIRSDRDVPSIFLLEYSNDFQPGPVFTAYSGRVFLHIAPNDDSSLERRIQLRVGDTYELGATYIEENRHIHLEIANLTSGVAQRFDLGALNNYALPQLYWAGDIDRDGKLDFFMQTSLERFQAPTLFLSSLAEEGKLVRPAAQDFISGSC